jgi:phage tail-like protein
MGNTTRTISENRFAVEIDGIPGFKASKVTGFGEKHEPVKVNVGNDPYAILGRGNVEPDDIVITIPSGLYDNSLRALQAWVSSYFDGVNTAPKSGRCIVYDDAGRTPVETWEMRDCVPLSLNPDDKSADGSNSSTVTLTLKPYKVRRI